MKSIYQDLLPEVQRIALQAGVIILQIYEKAEGWGVERKADDSPLTLADRQSNDRICKELEKLNPKFPIISEENQQLPYEQRKDYEYFWLVDPLDGTKEFIKRNGEFTVNIALVRNNRPVLGVVYVPVKGQLYFAIEGEGAFLRQQRRTEPLQANSYKSSDKGLRIVCSRSHLNEETQAFIDAYQEPEKVAKGSSLKFLILAAGGAELYPRLAPTMEWDTAAAQIILEEAGGSVVRADDGKPLTYNKESLRNPHFVARGKEQA